MSAKHMGAVFDIPAGVVSMAERLVLLALADNADHKTGVAWPSVGTLAEKCDVSERTVQRSLKGLVEAGLIAVVDVSAPMPDSEATRRLRLVPAARRPTVYRVVWREWGDTASGVRGDSVTGVSVSGGDNHAA